MKRKFLLLSLFFCFFYLSYGQAGRLDSSFGANGIVRTDLGARINSDIFLRQVLIQPDGSMYAVIGTDGKTYISRRLANGSPDASYGHDGSSEVTVMDFFTTAKQQPDGKIVMAGILNEGIDWPSYVFIVVRYNTDGSTDNTFGKNGNVKIPLASNEGFASAIQPDNKILIANWQSSHEFTLFRYNADGSPDSTFDNDGLVTTAFEDHPSVVTQSMAIQTDGKIVLAGNGSNSVSNSKDLVLARYNTDGSLDSGFSADGKLATNFGPNNGADYKVAVGDNNKIVVAGIGLARYNSDGSPDITFDGDGKLITNSGFKNMLILTNGKIVTSETFDGVNVIKRYNADGSPDNTFSDDGSQPIDFENNSLSVSTDGKIVVGGSSGKDLAIARLNTNGSPDNTFDNDGKLTENLGSGSTFYTGSAAQPDGKIVAAGYTWNGTNYDFLITRYNTNGSLDTTFSGDGSQTTPFGSAESKAYSVVIENDGKIVAAGDFNGDFAVARYNIDGSLDNTFSEDGKQTTDFDNSTDHAASAAIQDDGKIVVAGSGIARYTVDGSLDISFDGDGKLNATFVSADVKIQKDEKIVVAGTLNGDFAIARYNTNGSPDITFGTDGLQTLDFFPWQDPGFALYDDYATSVAIQKDGKIVVAGYWEIRYHEISSNIALAGFNSDGSLDSSFSDDGMLTTNFGTDENAYQTRAHSLALQHDDKIVVGGYTYHTISAGTLGDFALA